MRRFFRFFTEGSFSPGPDRIEEIQTRVESKELSEIFFPMNSSWLLINPLRDFEFKVVTLTAIIHAFFVAFMALGAWQVAVMLCMGILFIRFGCFLYDFIVKPVTPNASFVLSIIDHLQSRISRTDVARTTLHIFAHMSVR